VQKLEKKGISDSFILLASFPQLPINRHHGRPIFAETINKVQIK